MSERIAWMWVDFPGLGSQDHPDYKVGDPSINGSTLDSIEPTVNGYDIYVRNKDGLRYRAEHIRGCNTIVGYEDPNASTIKSSS